MIRWPLRRRQKARPIEPLHMDRPRCAELETAKRILAEIFCVRKGEVKEMIQAEDVGEVLGDRAST